MKTAHDIILKPVITEASMQALQTKSTPLKLQKTQTRSKSQKQLQNCLA
jgi:ribosomal protein L23